VTGITRSELLAGFAVELGVGVLAEVDVAALVAAVVVAVSASAADR